MASASFPFVATLILDEFLQHPRDDRYIDRGIISTRISFLPQRWHGLTSRSKEGMPAKLN